MPVAPVGMLLGNALTLFDAGLQEVGSCLRCAVESVVSAC
jgi:hypothetical protein